MYISSVPVSCEVTAGSIVRSARLEIQVGEIVAEKTWTTTSPVVSARDYVKLYAFFALQSERHGSLFAMIGISFPFSAEHRICLIDFFF